MVIPVTTPEPEIVAREVLLLAQIPPPVVSVRDAVLPVQTIDDPVIGLGAGETITLMVVVAVWYPLFT